LRNVAPEKKASAMSRVGVSRDRQSCSSVQRLHAGTPPGLSITEKRPEVRIVRRAGTSASRASGPTSSSSETNRVSP